MKMSARQITIAGLMSAISIFLGATRLGFIPFLTFSITVLHVPVILGAVLEGPWVGTIIGFIFGAFSLLQAGIAPQSPSDAFFLNPLVSIFPRLFIGVVAWLAYEAIRPLNEIGALAAAGLAGTLTNTVLVLGMLVILGYIPLALAVVVASTNAPFEIIAAILITVAVVATWKRLEYGRRGADL
jgi:uncharacterized membrane protein